MRRRVLDLARVRELPEHFGWIDHRLRSLLVSLTHEEMLLLFWLHLAADRDGLSFYGDARVCHHLGLSADEIVAARGGLLRKSFIAYRYPLYQLLELPERPRLSAQDLASLRRSKAEPR
jgi:hypothetical protein